MRYHDDTSWLGTFPRVRFLDMAPCPPQANEAEMWWWVPHPRLEFVPGRLEREEAGLKHYRTAEGEVLRSPPGATPARLSPPSFTSNAGACSVASGTELDAVTSAATVTTGGGVQDLTHLATDDNGEAAILHECRARSTPTLPPFTPPPPPPPSPPAPPARTPHLSPTTPGTGRTWSTRPWAPSSSPSIPSSSCPSTPPTPCSATKPPQVPPPPSNADCPHGLPAPGTSPHR